MKKFLSIAAIPVAAALMPLAPTAQAEVPSYVMAACEFPADYKIGANTPPEYRQYIGIYVGHTEGPHGPAIPHTRNVTDIYADGRALGYYIIDNYPKFGLHRECSEEESQFKDGVMTRTSHLGTNFEYRFDGNIAHFKRLSSRFLDKAVLTKQPIPPE